MESSEKVGDISRTESVSRKNEIHNDSTDKNKPKPGVALGSQTEHSCLVHLIITPCISCLSYAREPEARPLGWLALKITYVMIYNNHNKKEVI